MEVEVRKFRPKKVVIQGKNRYEVEQEFGLDMVLADGVQVGWTPNKESDPNYKILHPLSSNAPQEFFDMVVENSGGELRGSLGKPTPHEVEDDEEDSDDES